MWKTILFGHDFSVCARRVEPLVVEIARTHGARVVLLHVSELPQGLSPDTRITPPGRHEPVALGAHTLRATEARLGDVAARLRAAGVDTEVRALIDDIPRGILESARETAADLVVLGTHGREGLRHFFLGSVAEKVFRRATVPVLTLRTPIEEDGRVPEEQDLEDELAG
jgi:nucleotide-binding universal stress UspA family protein